MNKCVFDSVKKKEILEFQYDNCLRVVEPHAYGLSTKGEEVLRCYQIEGESNSGPFLGWRLMKTSKMQGLKNTGKPFKAPREGYKKGDKGMIRIFIEL